LPHLVFFLSSFPQVHLPALGSICHNWMIEKLRELHNNATLTDGVVFYCLEQNSNVLLSSMGAILVALQRH